MTTLASHPNATGAIDARVINYRKPDTAAAAAPTALTLAAAIACAAAALVL